MAICHDTDKEAFQKLVNYFKEQLEDVPVELSLGYSWTMDGEMAEVIREAHEYLEKDKQRLLANNDYDGKMRRQLADRITQQMKDGNFRVFLQPKVDAVSEEVVGGEALIRLYTEGHGYAAPSFFIPVMEERGVIHMIDLFVLEEVFMKV
jgi:hypothetical protein